MDMHTIQIILGVIIVIATAVAILKRFEVRMVLIVAGFALAIIAGDWFAGFSGLTDGMTRKSLICNICSVMGFAYVMKYTGCDKHLGNGIAGILSHMRPILIPAATLATWFVNISLPSCAGTSAAVGSVVIPLLMSQGVHPALAAGAVIMGTFGEMLSPGMPHNPMVAEISSKALQEAGKITEAISVMDVIARHTYVSVGCGVLAAILLYLVGLFVFKETKGYVEKEGEGIISSDFKVNPFLAIIPIIPVTMLVIGGTWKEQLPWLAKLRVEHCMLIGAVIGILATPTRKTPGEGSKQFFAGLGKGYADVMGIVIAAQVFVAGLKTIGLVDASIGIMKSAPSIAAICAGIGPFFLAVVTGTGNAATIAFNESVTGNALQLGVDPVKLGSLATVSGCLGRAMSPVAGGMIVCATLAGADPMDVAKRTAIPAIVATIVFYFVTFWVMKSPYPIP